MNRNLWQASFQQYGIRHNAHICTNTDQGYTFNRLNCIHTLQTRNQFRGSKIRFINDKVRMDGITFFCGRDEALHNLPTNRIFHTMHNWQMLTFLAFKIISIVSISCKNNWSIKGCNFLTYIIHDGLSLWRTKRAIHKIMLHINYD